MHTLLLFLLMSAWQTGPAAGGGLADYVVGPQDVLSVNVLGEAELTKKYTVGNDGAFDFPHIGRIEAKGLTLRNLEELIGRRLVEGKFFVARPQITIEVEQFRSQKVWVTGDVAQQGEFPLTGSTSIVDIMAAAKLNPTAGEEIVVNRRRDAVGSVADGPVTVAGSDVEVFRVAKADILNGRAGRLVSLRHGDTIVVPKAAQIFVAGEVKNPNRFTIEGQLTVLQAIALAGGPTDRGAAGRATILRFVDGRQRTIKVKMSDLVLPGDTINVPKKWF